MSDLDDLIDFMRDVIKSTMAAALRPSLFLPAVLFSLATDTAVTIIEWPFRQGMDYAQQRSITIMVLVILAKGWFSLTLCRIALAGFRRQVTGVLNQWVSVQDALRIAVVTVTMAFPVMLGMVFFLVPGLYLLTRWSQVTLALIDGEAQWFDAAEISSSLTKQYMVPVFVLLLGIGIITAVIEMFINDITVAAWIYRAIGSTVGAGFAAALYYELSRRAPWHPEAQR